MIHWYLEFSALDGKTIRVNIHDSAYSGTAVRLTGAAEPLETEEESDDDIMKAVRVQSGYLRLIDADASIMPTNNSQRYVTVLKNGLLAWQGYIKAEQYSVRLWDRHPEMELAIESCLGQLRLKDIESGDGMVTFGGLVAECLQASGGQWTEVIYPSEVAKGADYSACWKIKMIKGNIFQNGDTDEEDPDYAKYQSPTYMEVLENVAKMFGWCVMERGSKIVFVSRMVSNYCTTTWENFKAGNYTYTRADASVINVSDLSAGGTNNTRSVVDGYRRLKVSADVNPAEELIGIPTSANGMRNQDVEDVVYSQNNREFYGCGYLSDDSTLNSYHAILNDGDIDEIESDTTTITNLLRRDTWGWMAAEMTWGDFYMRSEVTSGLKKEYNYKYGVLLAVTFPYDSDAERTVRPTRAQMLECPLIELESDYDVCFNDNGCISIDFTEENIGYGAGGYWTCSLECGGKYYNGSYWTNTFNTFELGIGLEQKHLNPLYPGASGVIIPCPNGQTVGRVKFKLYPSREGCSVLRGGGITLFFEQNLMYKAKTKNTYYDKTNYDSSEKYSVDLFATTFSNNCYGLGLLYWDYSFLTDHLLIRGVADRIEKRLMNTLKTLFGKSRKVLALEVCDYADNATDLYAMSGENYGVIGVHRNWRDSVVTLNIESL